MHILLKLPLLYEGLIQLRESIERHNHWNMSREYSDEVGKPLLRIGMRKSFLEPPNGDYTIDIDPLVKEIEGGIWADERCIPFGDKQFGVCFNEHTLEHLHNPQDVQDAVNECVRVADKAVFLAPSPYSIIANLHPTHFLRLWVDPINNKIRVERNRYRISWNIKNPPRIGQYMITQNTAPQIVTLGSGFTIS